MKKRLFALILICLTLLTLASCGGETPEDEPAAPDASSPAPSPVEHEPDPEPEDEPPAPGSRLISDGTYQIDLGWLEEQGMTVESVFAASDDLLFIFAGPIEDGVVSEQVTLYTYSVKNDGFTGSSVPVGTVGQYPQYILDDGSVPVVTINSETYAWKELLMIDPNSLSCRQVDLSSLGDDVRSVYISPDSEHLALSTGSALEITDRSLETMIASFDGYVDEGGDPDLDYRLPCAYGWTRDSQTVIGGLLGWEWVCHPILLGLDGSRQELTDCEYLAALPYGDGLLVYDNFAMRPKWRVSLSDMALVPVEIPGLPADEDEDYISAMAPSPDGEVIAAATASGTGGTAGFYRGSELIRSFAIESQSEYPPAFEYVGFSPSGDLAVMMTTATVDAERAVYFTELP